MTTLGAMKRTNSLVKRNPAQSGGDDDDSRLSLKLATSHHETQQSEDTANSTMAGKRKKPEYQPGRFKAVSQLVLAMNRFKGTTYVKTSVMELLCMRKQHQGCAVESCDRFLLPHANMAVLSK